MQIRKITGLIFLLLFLQGCVGLSAKQCRQTNWYTLGVAEGKSGVSSSAIQRYIEQCSEHGVSVDRLAYNKGHTEGLKAHCTVEVAQAKGRQGTHFNLTECDKLGQETASRAYLEELIARYQQQHKELHQQNKKVKDKVEELKNVAKQTKFSNPHFNNKFEELLKEIEAQGTQIKNIKQVSIN